MEIHTIALFGETEKGEFHTPYYCRSLNDLIDNLGNPPQNTQGLYCAIQALLYNHTLLFFRVQEEGFSDEDYLNGLEILYQQTSVNNISAICLPGVGSAKILSATLDLCKEKKFIVIVNHFDFYDYLTDV